MQAGLVTLVQELSVTLRVKYKLILQFFCTHQQFIMSNMKLLKQPYLLNNTFYNKVFLILTFHPVPSIKHSSGKQNLVVSNIK